MYSDYGQALDSDLVRLRMELNNQQKNLTEQLNLLKFKAKQQAQERDQAQIDLDRLLQNLRDRTNRHYNHEKPLDNLKTMKNRERLYSQRGVDNNALGGRRNLDTYKDIFFNNFKNPNDYKFAHNDNDPFNINVQPPAQPKMHYNYNNFRAQSQMVQNPMVQRYETSLKTNSQAIGIEPHSNMNFSKKRPDPVNYGGINEFTNASSKAMNQIDSMIDPDNHMRNRTESPDIPTSKFKVESNFEDPHDALDRQLDAIGESFDPDPQYDEDQHHESMQQLDNVLDSIVDH